MADLAQLQQALIAADAAGDTAGATVLAQEIKRIQSGPNLGPLKAAGSGAAEGAISTTVGMPGDLGQAGRAIQGMAEEKFPWLKSLPARAVQFAGEASNPLLSLLSRGPTTSDISGAAGVDYQPQNTTEKYIKSTAAGASGAALMPGGGLTLRSLLGALSGAAGQAGEDASGSQWGRAIAAVLPWLASAPFTMRKPNVVKAAQSITQDVGEPGLMDAFAATQAAKARGGDYLLTQGIPNQTQMSGLTQELASSPQGEAIRRVLEKQVPYGQQQIDEAIARVSGRDVGQTEANLVADAGNKVIADAKAIPSSISGEFYDTAKKAKIPVGGTPDLEAVPNARNPTEYWVPPTTAQDIVQKLRAERGNLSLSQAKSGAPLDIAASKIEALAKQYPDGIPATELDSIAREARIASGSKETAFQMKKLGNDRVFGIINDALAQVSPDLAAGKGLHAAAAEAFTNPVEKSVLTTMFPKSVQKTGKGSFDTAMKVFDGSPADVRFAATNLNNADPEAFPNIVKAWMQDKLSATGGTVGGRATENILNDFPNAVAGPPGSPQRAVFREAMNGVAKAQGLEPQAYTSAAESLMDDLLMSARDRGASGAINAGELQRAAGSNIASGISRGFNFIQPLRGMGRALERHLYSQTYSKLSDAIASGNVRQLIDIANYSGASERTKALLQAAASMKAGAEASQLQ